MTRGPTHKRLGGKDGHMTACGLFGIQHRPLKYSDYADDVTCRSCWRWMNRHAEKAGL